MNDWVLGCLSEEQLDRDKALARARKTPFWPIYEARIIHRGWTAVVDEARRAVKVKFSNTAGQLEFPCLAATEGGDLKELLELNKWEWRYRNRFAATPDRQRSSRGRKIYRYGATTFALVGQKSGKSDPAGPFGYGLFYLRR